MPKVKLMASKKEERTGRIIDAALNLFSKKNYHEVMMEDVAKQAQIAKGTVYNYFSSKEELYFFIMRVRMEKLTVSLKEQIKTEMNSVNSLRTFILHLYMFMMKYKNFFMMYRKESVKNGGICPELYEFEKDINLLLSSIVRKGMEEGNFRNIEDDFAVDLILSSVYSGVKRSIEKNFEAQLLSLEAEKIFDFILHGLLSGSESDSFPLKSKTIVITRTIEQSKESSEAFSRLGANVVTFPTLEIVPPKSWSAFDEVVTSRTKLNFIIFTSAHAVAMFSRRCAELNVNPDYNSIKIVAVGNKTAAVCEKYGIPVHIVPSAFSGAGVIAELIKYDLRWKVIFIPRSSIGREELPKGLEELGAIIKTAPVYDVTLPSLSGIKNYIELLNSSRPDLFIFTSPSTFKNFLEILKIKDPEAYFSRYDVAAIGPTTKSAIENQHVEVNIIPDEYTIDGLVKATINYYRNKTEQE